MTRTTRIGAVLAALYLAVAAATTSWAPGRVRPLYDGFGSHPGQYNWVSPPREFAEGNQRPESAEGEISFEAAASLPASAGPNDGQALAALPPGSVAAHPPDTRATVTLTPLDAATLGPLPAGLRPEGNAYRVDIAYSSGAKVVALEKPGTVGLTSVVPADTLLYSLDGKAWETTTGKALATGNGVSGPLAATGHYLAAAKGPLRAAGSGPVSGATVFIIVAALAVPAALAVVLLRRRPAPGRGAKAAGGRPRAGTAGGRAPGKGGGGPAPGGKGTAARTPKGKGGPGAKPRR